MEDYWINNTDNSFFPINVPLSLADVLLKPVADVDLVVSSLAVGHYSISMFLVLFLLHFAHVLLDVGHSSFLKLLMSIFGW